MDTHDQKVSGPLFGLGLLILATIGVSLLPASWFGIKPARKTYARVDLSNLSLDAIAQDSDKDGSISWKELVTDSLSLSDLAQIEGKKPDPAVIADLNDPNNLTASFSKNLYTVSAYLSKNQLNDPLAEQEVINQLIAKEAVKMVPKEYTLKDIAVAKTENRESIKAYGNSVASLLAGLITEKTIADDFSSVQGYIETQDKSALEAITKDHAKVSALLDKLVALPAPLSAATYHILMIERISLYKDTLYNLSKVDGDPVRSTLSIQQYPEVILKTLRIYSQLSSYFDTQNIVFTSKDPGYVFTVGYTLK
jgi:hypothetical protein